MINQSRLGSAWVPIGTPRHACCQQHILLKGTPKVNKSIQSKGDVRCTLWLWPFMLVTMFSAGWMERFNSVSIKFKLLSGPGRIIHWLHSAVCWEHKNNLPYAWLTIAWLIALTLYNHDDGGAWELDPSRRRRRSKTFRFLVTILPLPLVSEYPFSRLCVCVCVFVRVDNNLVEPFFFFFFFFKGHQPKQHLSGP